MTTFDPAARPSRFPWWVYLALLACILLFTIAPFGLMVGDSGLGVLLVITAPMGMGALIVWVIILAIHRIAWGKSDRAAS